MSQKAGFELILIILIFFLSRASFANNDKHLKIGSVQFRPLVFFGKEVLHGKANNFSNNQYGGHLALEEGKEKFNLTQFFSLTYSPNHQQKYDHRASGSINLLPHGDDAKTIFSLLFDQEALTNLAGNQLFEQEHRTQSTAYQVNSTLPVTQATVATFQFFHHQEKVAFLENNIQLIRRRISSTVHTKNHPRWALNLVNEIAEATEDPSLKNAKTTKYSGEFSYRPFSKTSIGVGYSQLFDSNLQMERTPYLYLECQPGEKAVITSKIGQSFYQNTKVSRYGLVNFNYIYTNKTKFSFLTEYGLIRDPLLNVAESYRFELNFHQEVGSKMTLELSGNTVSSCSILHPAIYWKTNFLVNLNKNIIMQLNWTSTHYYQLYGLNLAMSP